MDGLRIKDFLAREGARLGIRKQDELAGRLGVSDQTVSNWVKGKTFPTHEMEYRLLEMGMTVEELFGYPFPSSADSLRQKGALWEAAENSLMNLKKDIHMKK
ncbi:helix-turn-helix transcriptional regulator [Fibrobacter sp.]|uniref:helix-turn-helix transcriptional regulator n=1 Tax=Fibrobacter sp. TaxID=35828 RepID=UPI00386BCACE